MAVKYYREQHDLMRTNQHNLHFILKYYREQLFYEIKKRLYFCNYYREQAIKSENTTENECHKMEISSGTACVSLKYHREQ